MPTSRDPLAAMLDELSALSDPATRARVAELSCRLAAGDLRVALVGEAKRGKSTFGNALLGEEVLPTGVIPVTSISTEVRAGSPRRAEISFIDASTHTTGLDRLEEFVSERLNANNRRHVTAVNVYLPAGLPHRKMVLIDTPGVGSVHVHNTQVAQEAFAAMDAAVFVLTADPPISGSELALLREVAGLAVRVFVVLNKADQLEPPELEEAASYVSEVVAEALGARRELWICSSRQGIRARAGGDEEGWRASGVADFLDALMSHLVEHRERDLRASVAAAAARLASQRLDALSVTLAAIDALQTDEQGRLAAFDHRLALVDQRRDEALQFVTAHLERERSRLDTEAGEEVSRVAANVRSRLDGFLAERDGLPLAELECEARDVVAGATRDAVEVWRERWHIRLESSYMDLVQRQQGLLEEASGDLHAAALEHLGVRLRGEVPVLREPDLPAFRYDFEPEVGWNHAWVSGARTRVPARLGRRRVENYVRGEATRIVDKHLGRARAEFQARLENAGRLLQAQVAAAFADLTDGLRTGQQAAVEIRTQSAPGQERERRRLSDQRRALIVLADALGEVAEQRDHTLLSARTGPPPTGVRST
jgi:GTPase SAR1 family protein